MSFSIQPPNLPRKTARISVKQVWRKISNEPQSSTPSQNLPPLSTSKINSQPSPPSLLSEEEMTTRLQLLSRLLETNLSHATNTYSQIPTSPHSPPSPLIHPATLDQVNFHSGFCHCCMYTRNQLQSLKGQLDFIQSLLTHPPRQFPPPSHMASPFSSHLE